MKKWWVVLLFFSQPVWAQLPQTRIYLFDLERNPKGYSVVNPKLVSKSTGYNNQPYFSPEGKYLYYSSSIDSTNTEIFRIDIDKRKLRAKRITRSKEPEYSPKLTVEEDRISCVSVEKDKVTQHLYTYNLKGKKAQIILPELKTIGYYEWMTPYEFLSFELPEPFYFVKHNLNNGDTDTLADHIGRTFYYLRSRTRILYIDKTDTTRLKFRLLHPNPKRKLSEEDEHMLGETMPGEEDFCVMNDGSLLQGHKGILYIKKNPFKNKNAKWEAIADLTKFGIKRFQRIAIHTDNTKLAVVAMPN